MAEHCTECPGGLLVRRIGRWECADCGAWRPLSRRERQS